ncbi:MAG: aldo/keto reductase [Gemmataceae bacterium]
MAALGRPGYINLGHGLDLPSLDRETMERHAHEVLDAAFAAGIRYFDAARSYGDGERFLASWFESRGIASGQVVAGSKWGYTYTAGWQVQADKHEVKDHSLEVLQLQVRESLEILGPWLMLYQIHSATMESGVLSNHAVLDELKRLRENGLFLGLSVSGPRQHETLSRAMDTGIFDVVQATWNLLDPSAGPCLAQAHAAGMGVIIKEALANGRLTGRNQDPAFASRRKILEAQARRLDCGIDALALAAVRTRPWVDVVLSGAASVSQLRQNAGCLAVAWDEECEQALLSLAESPAEYWDKRSTLSWN